MSLEDQELNHLQTLITNMGGYSNIRTVKEGVEELFELIKDRLEDVKEGALTELKEMYFEDFFGDIHDAIREFKEEKQREIQDLST